MARKGRAGWCERPWSQAEEISQCGWVGGALSSQGPRTAALPFWPQLELAPAPVAKETSDVNQGNSAHGAGSAGWDGQKQVSLGEGGWSKDGKAGDRSVYVGKGQEKRLPSAGLFLRRPLAMAVDSSPLPVSSHGFPSVCVLISSS